MNKKIISIISIIAILLMLFSSTCHASASAKVFSCSKSPVYNNCCVYAVDGLSRLGYSPCTSSMGAITKSSMMEWISATGNNYGLYVHTLGGPLYFCDYYYDRITASDVSGYWDFVFIDASESANDASLANAFHCTGYANRCYLGWNGVVQFADAEEFNYYFWLENVGHNRTIYSCALNASACVPGSGTTPIRLYGSTTYTGVAR